MHFNPTKSSASIMYVERGVKIGQEEKEQWGEARDKEKMVAEE